MSAAGADPGADRLVAAAGMSYDQTASDGASGNRRLLAMLFVDLVRSTDAAASMGDAGWVSLLGAFRTQAETTIVGYEGRLIKWIGDGFLATFAVPAGAVGCGIRLVEEAREMDLEIRAGVHTSEVVLEGDDIAGIAVHIAARIMALASPSEVLVSRTTVEVTAGTDLAYSSRGLHRLKGIPGDWDLFAAADSKEGRLTDIEPADQVDDFFEVQTLVERDRELTIF
jgi:class 3 adenylate cyclase